MWKVMIADDEPNIRSGLRLLLEKSDLDLQICGEAENGLVALSIAKESRPDILLLDICMPHLNGLQLISQLKSELTDCRIIIITGHDEFEYAQRALKLKVFDYILKPIAKNHLYEVIKKAMAELNESRSANKYIEWANRQLKKNIPHMRERFLNDFMYDKLSGIELDEQLDFLGINFAKECGILIIKPEEKYNIGEQKKEWDRYLLLFAIQNIVEELINNWKPNLVFKDDKFNIVVIIPIKSLHEWVDIGSTIEKTIEVHLGQTVLVCSEKVDGGISEIPIVYSKLLAELHKNSHNSPIIMLVKKFIDENYNNISLSLQESAQVLKISPNYLSRLLKQEEGYSFTEYLTIVRVKKAIRLMENPNLKVCDIAERVGYNTQHYFCTAFKRVLGVSPTEYRKGGVDG